MAALLQDLRFALRQFRRSPGLFAVAAILIALGIAANVQISTFVNALLLRPLPVHDPENLVQLFEILPRRPDYPYFDFRFYRQLASRSRTLFQTAAQIEWTISLERGADIERSHPVAVTDNFFEDLGVRAQLGRLLSKGDDHVAVLSYRYWQSSFGRDPKVIGQPVRLNGHSFQIIGVTPPEFTGTVIDSSPDLWIPYSNTLDFWSGANPNLDDGVVEIIARVQPGVMREQAEQEAALLWRQYMDEEAARHPEDYKNRMTGRMEARSISHGLSPMRKQSASTLVLLLVGTGLLLLMVCANVGGLLLARATSREKETAVRLAIGASRVRIFQQWLAESLLLTSIGGCAGILLGYASLPQLARWLPPAKGIGTDPAEVRVLTLDLHPDVKVLVFTIFLCLLAALLSALAPAWRASRRDFHAVLKATISDRGKQRLQSVLCAVQVAVCMVLMISAGLMAQSLANLRALDAGFSAQRIVTFSVDTDLRRYRPRQAWSLRRRLLDGARTLPGVEASAIASRALMRGIGLGNAVVFAGQKGNGIYNTSVNVVTPEYFELMNIPLVAGRGFLEADEEREGAVTSVVVNEAFVRKFLQGQNPIGTSFGTGKEFVKPQFLIVGVVRDTKYRSLREVPPPIYYTYSFGPQSRGGTFSLHVRTAGDPRGIIAPMRKLLNSIDPQMPFYEISTVTEDIDRSLWTERLAGAITSSLSVLAMIISAIGLYGILAYFVAGRRRELGLRMALGAQVSDVIWLVWKHVVPILVVGGSVGVALAFLSGKVVESLLFGVAAFDLQSTLGALLLLSTVAIAAALLPILRAIRVDPASTLRQE